jgi:hypothetical protein
MNKLNLKIIAPISVAILIGTIWILSGKNSTEETRLTNNYQAKQIIWHDETKHEGISVNTTKDQLNEDRSTILVATPVTKNKTINETLQQFSQKFINEFYKEAQKQESAYKKYIAKTNLESATFITNYVQNLICVIREKIWQIYFLTASSVKCFRGGTIISAAASISVLVKTKSTSSVIFCCIEHMTQMKYKIKSRKSEGFLRGSI